jgi:hypothetical protein
MELAGFMGKLIALWGLVGLILASMTHDRGYPAATWLLAYFGLMLITVGALLWWRADAAKDKPAPSPERNDWLDR